MKKVVVIGGGTGQSALLRGLKKIENIKLTTPIDLLIAESILGGREER